MTLKNSLVATTLLVFAVASVHAAVVNLTTAGSSQTLGDALFQQINPQSTGTGVIDSFAQLNPIGNPTTERAYNTTVNGVFDNQSADNFNHSLLLSDVPVVNIGGVNYRQFLLDINENNNAALDQFISLDDIQIFLGSTLNPSSTTLDGTGLLQGVGTNVYRLDVVGSDNWVALNYALNTGSGSGDMFLNVRDSLFTGPATQVVTLYSVFGVQGILPANGVPAGNYGVSDGFEEWAVLRASTSTPGVPDGGTTVLLLGAGLTALAALRRKIA